MKIVFIYPESENLGVEYLSACLKKSGHQVKLIFDPMLFGSYYFRSVTLQKLFSYKTKIIKEVVESKCDLVCFSIFSDYYGWASELAQEIKQQKASIKTVFGGIHPSSVPERVICKSFVDYVCVGEGEEALVELADRIQKGQDETNVKNIWLKKDGNIIKNEIRPLIEDLDALPFPDKELFKHEYKNLSGKVYSILTSRGCPNSCTYCYNNYYKKLHKNKGKYLRRRSVKNVMDELILAKERYSPKRVAFFDDLFIYDINWLEEFCEEYRAKINLPYFCHVHPENINEKSVTFLKKSRCSTVTMGIQTIDETIRKKVLNRYDSNDEIKNAIKLLMDSGIFLYTNIIFGLPLQDEAVMIEDVRFANQHRVDIPASNWLRCYPKTQIIKIAKETALLTDADITKIEESSDYMPYSIKGTTYTKAGAKLRNLLLLSHLLPKKMVDYILTHKLYRFLPSGNLRFYLQTIIILFRRLLLGKSFPFAYISLTDVVRYHSHYIFKKFKER